jgi:hypothetical protein
MGSYFDSVCGGDKHLPDAPTGRIGQLAVDSPETAEEAARSPECFVDELIDDDKVSRSNLLRAKIFAANGTSLGESACPSP